jgi:hypothetical protein
MDVALPKPGFGLVDPPRFGRLTMRLVVSLRRPCSRSTPLQPHKTWVTGHGPGVSGQLIGEKLRSELSRAVVFVVTVAGDLAGTQ